jgi:hypothetical protein
MHFEGAEEAFVFKTFCSFNFSHQNAIQQGKGKYFGQVAME